MATQVASSDDTKTTIGQCIIGDRYIPLCYDRSGLTSDRRYKFKFVSILDVTCKDYVPYPDIYYVKIP